MPHPKGRPAWNKGLKTGPLSVEHRRKISETLKGKPKPPRSVEHRRNHALTMKGKLSGSDSPHWKGGISKERRRNMKLIEMFRDERPEGFIQCHFCCSPVMKVGGLSRDSLVIHSLDGNHENWDPANKVPTHCACHISYHNRGERHYRWQGDMASDSAKRKRT